MKTTAVQVTPVCGVLNADVIAQFNGPDQFTTCWSVYERKEDGTATWFADTGNEDDAMWIGQHICELEGVGIEAQPWKPKKKE